MKKKTMAILFLVLGLMLYAGTAQGESAPLLYQVSDENGHIIYLLGTIHIGDESMYPLGPAVENAFMASELLAVEMDTVAATENVEEMLKFSLGLMYDQADENAQQDLSPETYALGIEWLEQPEFSLQRMRPAAWLSLVQEKIYRQIGQGSEWGVDMMLIKRAHDEGKPVEELESLASQMQVLLSIPNEIVDYQLQQMMLYPEAAGISLRLLSTAWRQGNEEILSLLLAQEEYGIPIELQAAYTAYADALYDQRDAAFEEKAKAYLAEGKTVLFAVGAAHIVGEGALADRLSQAGYQVKEIGR